MSVSIVTGSIVHNGKSQSHAFKIRLIFYSGFCNNHVTHTTYA